MTRKMESNSINVFLVALLTTFCALAEADVCEDFNFDTSKHREPLSAFYTEPN